MNTPRRDGGWVVVLLTIAALLGFWYVRSALTTPADVRLAAMPDEEFSGNAALIPPASEQEIAIELTPERYFELIKTYQTPDYLRWEVQVTVYSQSRERITRGHYLREGNDYTIEVTDSGGALVREVRMRSGQLTVRTPFGSMVSTAYDVYAPLPALGMAGLDALAELTPQQIAATRLEQIDGRQVIYVEFSYPNLPLIECYWVSIELGIPLRAESYYEDRLIYHAETVRLQTTSPGTEDGIG